MAQIFQLRFRLRRPLVRVAMVVAIAGLAILTRPDPAVADPARPTNYQSVVTSITPATQRVSVNVIGGDAYVVFQVSQGTAAEVAGYDGEPYLRFDADGTVRVNDRSPARWLNDERFGVPATAIPASVDPDAPPQWRVVANDGEYAWHDHRVHFMSPQLPRDIDVTRHQAQHVFEWRIPIIVNGSPAEVYGELFWLPPPPLSDVALQITVAVLVVTGLVVVLGWLPAVVGVALLTLAIGIGGIAGLPAGADRDVSQVVLPSVALVLTGAGWFLRRKADGQRMPVRLTALLAVVPLAVWAVLLAPALAKPVVPGMVAAGLIRSGVAAAAGLAITGAAIAINPAWRERLDVRRPR